MRRSGGCLDRSVGGIVEGECRRRSGIRWRVTSGGIARGSGVVENCWREQGRVGRGGILVPRRKLMVMVVVACSLGSVSVG